MMKAAAFIPLAERCVGWQVEWKRKRKKRLARTSINLFSVSLFSPSSFFAGTTSRRCSLDHRGVAYWEHPSYARCIANEYRYLQQSVGAKSASCALLLFVTCHKLSLQSSRSPKTISTSASPHPAPQTTTQVCKINYYHLRGKLKPLVLQFSETPR